MTRLLEVLLVFAFLALATSAIAGQETTAWVLLKPPEVQPAVHKAVSLLFDLDNPDRSTAARAELDRLYLTLTYAQQDQIERSVRYIDAAADGDERVRRFAESWQDTTAPLVAWKQEHAFDTAQQCERFRDQALNLVRRDVERPETQEQKIKNLFAWGRVRIMRCTPASVLR